MASQLENKYAGIAEALKEVQKQMTPMGLGKSLIKITTEAITFEDLPKYINPEIQNIEEELTQPLIIHNLPNKSILRISQTPRERIQELTRKLHRSNPWNNLSTLYKLYLFLNQVTLSEEAAICKNLSWTTRVFDEKKKVAQRVFYLYEACGKEYINQSHYVTPNRLLVMKYQDYDTLLRIIKTHYTKEEEEDFEIFDFADLEFAEDFLNF